MKSGFGIKDLLNNQSLKQKPAQTPQAISLEDIEVNSNNFYDISSIETLEASIQERGLMHPVTVTPKPGGGYMLIDGERRYTAVKNLHRAGYEGFNTIICNIRTYDNPLIEKLDLIMANATNRKMTPAEQAKEITETIKLFKDLKQSGYTFKGKLRDIVAEMFNVSSSKVAKIEAVENNLSEELKTELVAGKMEMSTAYTLSQSGKEQQNKAAQIIAETGRLDLKTASALKSENEAQSIIKPEFNKEMTAAIDGIKETTQSGTCAECDKELYMLEQQEFEYPPEFVKVEKNYCHACGRKRRM